uniref:Uncharacterized protein n=1 Tax=Arundo donax TaxID=35708 RepID=A0A0A9C893_ARUDO
MPADRRWLRKKSEGARFLTPPTIHYPPPAKKKEKKRKKEQAWQPHRPQRRKKKTRGAVTLLMDVAAPCSRTPHRRPSVGSSSPPRIESSVVAHQIDRREILHYLQLLEGHNQLKEGGDFESNDVSTVTVGF